MTAVTDDPTDPHAWPLGTPAGELGHAIAWAACSSEDVLRGRGTPAVHVFSFAERALAEHAAEDPDTGRALRDALAGYERAILGDHAPARAAVSAAREHLRALAGA